MVQQLHKRADDDLIKFIFQQYLSKKLSLDKALEHLMIKRSRFFKLLKKYKDDPESFSITYGRKSSKRIDRELEDIIIDELKKDKELIKNKNIPVRNYNYSYIKNQIMKEYKMDVSLPTIINRAKEHNYYIPKREHKKHDREVITNYPGELIQHDSSHHLFAPLSNKKWYLITSKTMFREFKLKPPFESTKDIFCIRETRKVDAYHKISFNNVEFQLQGVPLRENVKIKIVPDREKGVAELRYCNKINKSFIFRRYCIIPISMKIMSF